MKLIWTALPVIIIAAIVGVIGYFILPACAVRTLFHPTGWGVCPAIGDTALDSDTEKLRREQARLNALLRDAKRKIADLSCVPINASAEVQPVPPVVETITEEGVDLTKWQQAEVDLLDGCWDLVGDRYEMSDINTGEITVYSDWQMCFDSDGNGRQTLTSNDGKSECGGEITAEFLTGGNLQISDVGNVPCKDYGVEGGYIFARVVKCAVSDSGRAECDGWQPELGSERRSRFYLKRK